MSTSEYPKFYDFLKKVTADRGITREELLALVPGQTISLILDGTYSYRPTLFEFNYVSQRTDEEDPNSSIILHLVRGDREQEMDINTSDFGVEPIDPDKHITLRRLFADSDEARMYFEDVCQVYDVRCEEKIRSATYLYIYRPFGRSLGSNGTEPDKNQ